MRAPAQAVCFALRFVHAWEVPTRSHGAPATRETSAFGAAAPWLASLCELLDAKQLVLAGFCKLLTPTFIHVEYIHCTVSCR